MSASYHCYKCGWQYTRGGSPTRMESCHQCRADLRVCLNCKHYKKGVAHDCEERRAEPVAEKGSANFCEYFKFAYREWTGTNEPDAREQKAREDLKKLFGD